MARARFQRLKAHVHTMGFGTAEEAAAKLQFEYLGG